VKPNPVDEYMGAKEAHNEDRKAVDLHHWETWRQGGRQPEHLEPLFQRFQPLINQAVSQWRAPAIPKSVFEAEVKEHMIKAFSNYDPDKAALSTHVTNSIMRAHRYNDKHQNMAYIPKGQTQHIGAIQRVQNQLNEQLGRDPSREEIADALQMRPKQVGRIMTSMRRDVSSSKFDFDPTPRSVARETEVLDIIEPSLTHEEKRVFNHLYGRNDAETIRSTSAIARKLGKNPSQISRIRTSILKKVEDGM
jgi:DNA-directed RNA polymerase specialized sigma subunit